MTWHYCWLCYLRDGLWMQHKDYFLLSRQQTLIRGCEWHRVSASLYIKAAVSNIFCVFCRPPDELESDSLLLSQTQSAEIHPWKSLWAKAKNPPERSWTNEKLQAPKRTRILKINEETAASATAVLTLTHAVYITASRLVHTSTSPQSHVWTWSVWHLNVESILLINVQLAAADWVSSHMCFSVGCRLAPHLALPVNH